MTSSLAKQILLRRRVRIPRNCQIRTDSSITSFGKPLSALRRMAGRRRARARASTSQTTSRRVGLGRLARQRGRREAATSFGRSRTAGPLPKGQSSRGSAPRLSIPSRHRLGSRVLHAQPPPEPPSHMHPPAAKTRRPLELRCRRKHNSISVTTLPHGLRSRRKHSVNTPEHT